MTQEEKKDWIEKFLNLPTGNISDAMDSLGLRRGAVQGLKPLENSQRKAAGFAFTIRQLRRRTAYDGENLARQGGIMDQELSPGDLAVIDMGGIMDVCTGGAILALCAKLHGAVGELTNGCVRDAEEIAELGFPVYCAGTSPVKSAMDIETVGVNVPVFIGGIQICPGDLIVMDRTGAVCVPAEQICRVWEKAAEIQEREERMIRLVREGRSLAEARSTASLSDPVRIRPTAGRT